MNLSKVSGEGKWSGYLSKVAGVSRMISPRGSTVPLEIVESIEVSLCRQKRCDVCATAVTCQKLLSNEKGHTRGTDDLRVKIVLNYNLQVRLTYR